MITLKDFNLSKVKHQTKIFDKGNVLKSLNQCLEENYFPLNYGVIEAFKEEEIIDYDKAFATSTIFVDRNMHDATLDMLLNIEDMYLNGKKIIFVVNDGYNSSDKAYVEDKGCFVGVPIGSLGGQKLLSSAMDYLYTSVPKKNRDIFKAEKAKIMDVLEKYYFV